jgi:lipid-A-disaccharide synthase
MIAAGFNSWFEMDRLAVMGVVEVLGRLFELMAIRRALYQRLSAKPPDLFVGIDAPDFNLKLEYRMHASGLPVVHYVSPQVWAWRQRRVRAMARGLDLVLTLFPFETRVYKEHGLQARFVGHPMADEIKPDLPAMPARIALDIDTTGPVLAMLPGSRFSEVRRLTDDMLRAAAQLARQTEGLLVLVPCATDRIHRFIASRTINLNFNLRLFHGQARAVLTASNVALVASGTATLETALIGRPMVILYRMNGLTFKLLQHLVKVPHVGLPNLLCESRVVPEYLQDQIDPDQVSQDLLRLLNPGPERDAVLQRFGRLHRDLACNASAGAAAAITKLLAQQSRAGHG